MNRPASIPQHIWDNLSEEARAGIGAVIEGLESRIAELEARLNQNSTNSSKPPSSDPIGAKRKPPVPPSKRRRGGQKDHPRRLRALVPPERVASATDCKPTQCRRCGHSLSGEDADPRRHQVAELPPIEPEVREYRLHRLCCPHCQAVTSGALPDGVPRTSFGPRLHAALSVLTGAYRLSKRQVVQLGSDLLGLTISLGMVSKLERITADVLEQPVAGAGRGGEGGRSGEHRRDGLAGGTPQGLALGRGHFGGSRLPYRPLACRGGGRGPARRAAQTDRHQRSLPRIRVDRPEVETNLLGPPPSRHAGDDRPRR